MSSYHIIPPIGIQMDTANLRAGLTAGELAPIGGNGTSAKLQKFVNGIPQIPQ